VKTFLPFILTLCYAFTNAQAIKDLPLSHPNLTDQQYIVANKIRQINVILSEKALNERIRMRSEINYFFNLKGQVEKELQFNMVGDFIVDTTLTVYYYKNDLLWIKRTKTPLKYSGLYYEYDEAGNKIKEVNTIDFPAPGSNGEVIEKQTIISVDGLKHEKLSSTQTKITYLNDEGRPYKKAIHYFDEKGRLIEQDFQFLYTSIRSNHKFIFDNQGRLIEQTVFSDAGEQVTEKMIYTYTTAGLLEHAFRHKNGKATHQTFFFYSKNTSIPEATVTKDLHDNSMILKDFKIFYH
jgi:hypothetical protein